MDPAAIIIGGLFRSIDLPPALLQIVHQVAVGHLLQQTRVPRFAKDAGRCEDADEVDELLSDRRRIALDIRLIEVQFVLVPLEDQLQKPSVLV